MRFVQILIGVLHGLIMWRCFYIAWPLAKELREGANGIRGSLLILFTSLAGRSAWGLATAFRLRLTWPLLWWRLAGNFLTWLALLLLERELENNGDR